MIATQRGTSYEVPFIREGNASHSETLLHFGVLGESEPLTREVCRQTSVLAMTKD